MTRFGELLGGKRPEAPAPAPAPEIAPETVKVAESPIVDEDTAAYEEVIEEEVAEREEDATAAEAEEVHLDPNASYNFIRE